LFLESRRLPSADLPHQREKVLDIGPLQASTERHETIPLSPIVGIAAVAGGVALFAGSRSRA
jgi:hypothetical protein